MSNEVNNDTIGSTLKRKREELHLEIDNVSKRLNLKSDIIRDLEEENWHLINKNLYLVGLILSYSKLLMIDSVIIDEKIKSLAIKSNTENKQHQLVNIGENTDLTPDKDLFYTSIFACLFLIIISFVFFNIKINEKNSINYQELFKELENDQI